MLLYRDQIYNIFLENESFSSGQLFTYLRFSNHLSIFGGSLGDFLLMFISYILVSGLHGGLTSKYHILALKIPDSPYLFTHIFESMIV